MVGRHHAWAGGHGLHWQVVPKVTSHGMSIDRCQGRRALLACALCVHASGVEVATPGVHVMGRMAVAAVALLEMVRLAPEITEEERGALD